jgi:small subunit ribosomal protein S3Ae
MLKVIGVRGFQALTSVTEIELARAYVSSQANPGSDIIEDTINAKTSDGKGVRVKTLIFTHRKVHAEQKKALRNLAMEIVTTSAQRLDYDHFVQEIVFGKIGSQIFNKGKKVVPLGRVEIRKLELRAVKNE